MDKRTNEQMAKDLAKVTKHIEEMTDEEAEELKKQLDAESQKSGDTRNYPMKVFIDKIRGK